MRTLPPHIPPTRAVCVSDLRIQLLVAVRVGMVHMKFRRFNMCLCIFVVLAHLSQKLACEIGYSGPLSSVRPSTFSNGFSETAGQI